MLRQAIAFSFSLLIASAALAQPLDAWRRDVMSARATGVAREIVNDKRVEGLLKKAAQSALADGSVNIREAQQLFAELDIRLRTRLVGAVNPDTARTQALAIVSDPRYEKPQAERKENWIVEGISNLFDWLGKLRQSSSPREGPSGSSVVTISTVIGWIALIVAATLFVLFSVKTFGGIKRARRATAIVEEDEPDRTRDEWLELGRRLMAEGRHREAVRCFYVACLLVYDEAGIAAFKRGQTNWEHLRRIESAPQKLSGFDFRSPTMQFDRVWYGMDVRGQDDSEAFLSTYQRLKAEVAK